MDSIKDMRCPECGYTESFGIEIGAYCTVDMDGIHTGGECSGEWDNGSLAQCNGEDCDFSGTVADFVVETATEPAKHTPGDWYVKPSPERDGLDAVRDEERSFDPGEHETHVMCHLALEAYPNTRDLEFHAQRIVLAVNCHGDLLDMLKAVEARISIEQQEHMDDPAPGTYCCGAIHIELLALIAKAEGI